MKINHVGTHIFRGDMSSLAKVGVSATADKTSSQKSYKK
jgi:hypothetical protein